jgi:glutamine amidotransferase
MIGVVDYEAGNLTSVTNALSSIGVEYVISSGVETLSRCKGIILPGVGSAIGAMQSLNKRRLTEFLTSIDNPFLGICLGMQLLYERSEEGETECLGVVPGTAKQFDSGRTKVPHMGWNTVTFTSDNPLTQKLGNAPYMYFAHSYAAEVNGVTTGVTDCGVQFTSVMQKKNYFGVQFHPEKSGDTGLQLLKNFEAICRSYRR